MLKLPYLFENNELAEQLRGHWAHDAGPFAWYRISSNAVHPFTDGGEARFLRFAPTAEKRAGQVAAELDLLAHLRSVGCDVVEPVAARDGTFVVETDSGWGPHVAVVFRGVPGTQLSRTALGAPIVQSYVKTLAKLHLASADYRPAGVQPWSYVEVLDWIGEVLNVLPESEAARTERDMLVERLAVLPKDSTSFGVVHYDFECDNVFFDSGTGRCHSIDFDDAMYHWFAIDIEKALASLAEELDPVALPAAEQAFRAGYASIRPLPPDFERLRVPSRRFAALYWYARVRRAMAETLPDEPEWMVGLRRNLAEGLAERAASFGEPID